MKIRYNLKNILKHLFIPHEHNEYKPHFFREVCISILLIATLILFGLSATSAYILKGTEIGKEIISKVLVDMTNENRRAFSLPGLSPNNKLYNAALLKAEDMASVGYFAHDSPQGLTPWHFIELANYDYTYAGENLAINHTDNRETEQAWMNSPAHRKNILDPNFTEVGISAYSSPYQDKNTIFVVQMLAAPAEEVKIEVKNKNKLESSVLEIKEKTKTNLNKKEGVKNLEIKLTTNGKEEVIKVENKNPEVNKILDKSIAIASIEKLDTIKSEAPLAVKGESNTNYANLYEKLIYNGSNSIQNILQVIFCVVLLATFLMIFIEIERQHLKHIFYAMGMLCILLILMYINSQYLKLNFVI